MQTHRGIGVSGGVAIGPPVRLAGPAGEVARATVEDRETELLRFHRVQERAVARQEALYQRAARQAGPAEAELFHIHAMLITDPDLTEEVEQAIRGEGVCAEYAVQAVTQRISRRFAALEDDYMRERAGDFLDIGRQLVALLQGDQPTAPTAVGQHVLFAEDLLPSQAVQLDLGRVLAFVTQKGSAVSHTAILARTMGLPAVVGVELPAALADSPVIVDGTQGLVILDPSEEALAHYRALCAEADAERERLRAYRDRPTVTPDGRRIELCANIGHPDDVADALAHGAQGIGLFRSEFLYMDGEDFPGEEAQYRAYRAVLEAMGNRRVVIRTLDLGADKQLPYLHLPPESNPALGCRAIRLCLERQDIFLTQLRALLRASAHGRLGIMVPMITTVEEVRESRRLLERARAELEAQGISTGLEVEFGIMIETPAAALISRELAAEVDFFSVGTNDLTQYTLAADRMNSALATLYNPAHPAVLRLVELAAASAHEAGIWIGICGESAADRALLPFYLRIGIDELSMSPSLILALRRDICTLEPGVDGGGEPHG